MDLRNRLTTLLVPERLAVLAALFLAGCGGVVNAPGVLPLVQAQSAEPADPSRSSDLVFLGFPIPHGSALPVGPYDPPAGTYPFFPTSVFVQKIPSNPTVNPNSHAWLSRLGQLSLGKFQFHADRGGSYAQDYSFPIYPMSALARDAERVKIHCTAGWGTCSIEGKSYYVTPWDLPEDGGTAGEDSHLGLIDSTSGKEIDFYGARWPPKNGVLDVAWGGECSLAGDGYDGVGCASTATGTPLSIGIVRASDLLLAIDSPNASLPYALQVATKCSDGKISPMLGSDGTTAGCAPQGSRVYLAMHDAEIDAGSQSPIEKALLRTIDEDHFGMIITDTNGGQDGFCMQLESDRTYTAFGRRAPLVNQLVPEALREGLPGANAPYKGTYYIQLPMTGVDFASKLKFL